MPTRADAPAAPEAMAPEDMAPDIGAEDMAPDIGAEDIGAAAELMAAEVVELDAAVLAVLLEPQATRARARPLAAARTARRLMIMGEVLLLAESPAGRKCPRNGWCGAWE